MINGYSMTAALVFDEPPIYFSNWNRAAGYHIKAPCLRHDLQTSRLPGFRNIHACIADADLIVIRDPQAVSHLSKYRIAAGHGNSPPNFAKLRCAAQWGEKVRDCYARDGECCSAFQQESAFH